MMQQLPPVNLAHSSTSSSYKQRNTPGVSVSGAEIQTATIAAATAAQTVTNTAVSALAAPSSSSSSTLPTVQVNKNTNTACHSRSSSSNPACVHEPPKKNIPSSERGGEQIISKVKVEAKENDAASSSSTHTPRSDDTHPPTTAPVRVGVKSKTSSAVVSESGRFSGDSVNIHHPNPSSNSNNTSSTIQNLKEHPKEVDSLKSIVPNITATATATAPPTKNTSTPTKTTTPVKNIMSSATTAVNMNSGNTMSPTSNINSHGHSHTHAHAHAHTKQPLTVSAAVSFATPDTAEQRKVVGQVQGNRDIDARGLGLGHGPCHLNMNTMTEDMSCPTSNGSAAATVVSVRENEVHGGEGEGEGEADVALDNAVSGSAAGAVAGTVTVAEVSVNLNRSGSIVPGSSSSSSSNANIGAPTSTSTATVTPSTPASSSYPKGISSNPSQNQNPSPNPNSATTTTTTTTASSFTSATKSVATVPSATKVKQEIKETNITSNTSTSTNTVTMKTNAGVIVAPQILKKEPMVVKAATMTTTTAVKPEPEVLITNANTRMKSQVKIAVPSLSSGASSSASARGGVAVSSSTVPVPKVTSVPPAAAMSSSAGASNQPVHAATTQAQGKPVPQAAQVVVASASTTTSSSSSAPVSKSVPTQSQTHLQPKNPPTTRPQSSQLQSQPQLQPRSMTPVPAPSSHNQNTSKATRTPVRSPYPSNSSASMLQNANVMASDLFGSPGNSIFLSPAPGGGNKGQGMGMGMGISSSMGLGMTPTNFATDFGRTDLSTQSFDANNVLPWLSPKAYELFSPGTAGITPGGGMTAGITPGNQNSSHSNRLQLSMPVSKLLAENNALSLPFEGNAGAGTGAGSSHDQQDSTSGGECVDGTGITTGTGMGTGKKRTLGSVLGKHTKVGTIRAGHGRQVSQGSVSAGAPGQGICVSPLARKTPKTTSARGENDEAGSETPINFHDVFASPKADRHGSGMGYMSMSMNVHMGEHEIPNISEGRQTVITSQGGLEKDLAERDVMEDEDLNVLLKLAETTPRRNGAEGKTHARMFRGGNGTFAYPAVEPLYPVESVGGGGGHHPGTIHSHGPPSSLHLPIIGKRSPTPGSSSGAAGPLPKSLLHRPISSGSTGGRHSFSPKKRKGNSQSPATATTPGSVTSANSGSVYHTSSSHHHLSHHPPPQGYYHPSYMHGHHPHGHPMTHGHPPYPYSYPPHGHGQSAHGHPPPPHAPYMYPTAGSTLPSGPETVKDIKKKMSTKNPTSKSSIKVTVSGASSSKTSKRPLSTTMGAASSTTSKKSRKSGTRGRGPGKKKIISSSAHHAASMNAIDKQKAAATITAINNKSGKKNDRAASLAAAVLRGVTMRPSGKWQAQLYFAGKSRYIGVFDSREKAALAYEIAREHLQNKTASGSGKDTEAHVNAARKAAFEGVNENDPRGS